MLHKQKPLQQNLWVDFGSHEPPIEFNTNNLTIATTPANAHDVTQTENFLHGDEKRAWGDAGFQGDHKHSEFSESKIHCHIAMRPGKRRKLAVYLFEGQIERSKVVHPFLIIKKTFAYSRARDLWLAENTNLLYFLAAFANLLPA